VEEVEKVESLGLSSTQLQTFQLYAALTAHDADAFGLGYRGGCLCCCKAVKALA